MMFAQIIGTSYRHVFVPPRTQLYTESFAYPNATDLVADAPTSWAYTNVGVAFEVKGNLAFAWKVGPPEAGNAPPGFAKWIGAGTFAINQYSAVTLQTPGGVAIGPAVRISGTSGYGLGCQSSGCKIVKVVNGSATEVTQFGSHTSLVSGDVVELDATGTTPTILRVYVNGALDATYTDSSSTLSAGLAGIYNHYSSSNSGDTSFSNITGGNL